MKFVPIKFVRGAANALFLTLCLPPLTGCSQETEAGNAATTDVAVPPIYVAQTLVMKMDGQPMDERSYAQLLKACHDADMAVTPLSAQDVKKLGRTYYQLWFDSRHSAWQEDTWNFATGKDFNHSCQFHMTHESQKSVVSAKGRLSIDLIAKRASLEGDTDFAPGGYETPKSNAQADADASAEASPFKRLGYAQDAGQRCLRWRAPDPNSIETCTWSEGAKWGFTNHYGGAQVGGAYDFQAIVLWAHPPNGNGGELTTQKMTVGGQPFDDAVFAAPSGVQVETAEP